MISNNAQGDSQLPHLKPSRTDPLGDHLANVVGGGGNLLNCDGHGIDSCFVQFEPIQQGTAQTVFFAASQVPSGSPVRYSRPFHEARQPVGEEPPLSPQE